MDVRHSSAVQPCVAMCEIQVAEGAEGCGRDGWPALGLHAVQERHSGCTEKRGTGW